MFCCGSARGSEFCCWLLQASFGTCSNERDIAWCRSSRMCFFCWSGSSSSGQSPRLFSIGMPFGAVFDFSFFFFGVCLFLVLIVVINGNRIPDLFLHFLIWKFLRILSERLQMPLECGSINGWLLRMILLWGGMQNFSFRSNLFFLAFMNWVNRLCVMLL